MQLERAPVRWQHLRGCRPVGSDCFDDSLDRVLAQRRKSSIMGMFEGHSLGGFSPFRKRESSTAGESARACARGNGCGYDG
jgi:hypothetical protein